MPRDGSMTPRDLVGKLYVLRVECDKCGRRGRYSVASLVDNIGLDGKLTDWLYQLTRDCPRKQSPGLSDPCGARCPELLKLSRGADNDAE
jgi:hypothetical protein